MPAGRMLRVWCAVAAVCGHAAAHAHGACSRRQQAHRPDSNGTGCALEFGVDFAGHDLKSAKGEGQAVSSTAECAALCADTPRCSHFTHVWGRCFLKDFEADGSAPRPQAQRNATSGVCRRPGRRRRGIASGQSSAMQRCRHAAALRLRCTLHIWVASLATWRGADGGGW